MSLITSVDTVRTGTRQTQAQEESGASLMCIQELKLPSKKLGPHFEYTSQSPAWQCSFSRDGRWLAACYGAPDPCVRIWEVTGSSGGEDSPEFVLHATLHLQERTMRSVSFAPTKVPILASASFDGTIAIWECVSESSKEWECIAQLEGHDNEVKCVKFNATGSLLATCGRDKSVWIWECFLPGTIGGPDLLSSENGGGDFECLAVLNGHEGDVKCIEFASSHGQWGDGDEILISASYDNSIKVWAEDAGDWYCASTLSAHSATVWSVAIAAGGSRLISGSDDGSVGIFKCYTQKEKAERFPDAESGSNGMWDCVGKLPDAHSKTVYSVHCAPARAGHGRIASSGADDRIQVYREAMGSTSDQPLFSLEVVAETDHGDVNCVCWHPWDGSLLVSAGDDGSVRLWRYTNQ